MLARFKKVEHGMFATECKLLLARWAYLIRGVSVVLKSPHCNEWTHQTGRCGGLQASISNVMACIAKQDSCTRRACQNTILIHVSGLTSLNNL